MIKDKTQKIESGDSSDNCQTGDDNILSQSVLSYRDAKDLALNVFNDNYFKSKDEAKKTAIQRAEEITTIFLNGIRAKKPVLLNSLREPHMQFALLTAQESYAISGDKNTADLLVDILIERAEQNERNLKQIVLDESLKVVPKLTVEQLDTLTMIFLMRHYKHSLSANLHMFKQFLDDYVRPFSISLTKETSCYLHLKYCNCVTSDNPLRLERIFRNKYKGLFCSGISREDFELAYGNLTDFPNMLTECLHKDEQIQVNAIDDQAFRRITEENNLTKEKAQRLKRFFDTHLIKDGDLRKILINMAEYMQNVFDIWNDSDMKEMTLTTVGIALAQANFKRRTGIPLDLSFWIK